MDLYQFIPICPHALAEDCRKEGTHQYIFDSPRDILDGTIPVSLNLCNHKNATGADVLNLRSLPYSERLSLQSIVDIFVFGAFQDKRGRKEWGGGLFLVSFVDPGAFDILFQNTFDLALNHRDQRDSPRANPVTYVCWAVSATQVPVTRLITEK